MSQETLILPIGKASLSVPYDEAARILIGQLTQDAIKPRNDRPMPPPHGAYLQEHGGIYGGWFPGENGAPGYHLIWPTHADASIDGITFGGYGEDITGATSKYDGLANTRALVDSEHDHPAAQWAASQIIDGYKDFYLPAQLEYAHGRIYVPQIFDSGWHISSTQSSPLSAYGQNFDGGFTYDFDEHYECRARLVRRVSDLAL
jgi:hypothetical protein